jgi:hypothetical protein
MESVVHEDKGTWHKNYRKVAQQKTEDLIENTEEAVIRLD